MQENTPNVRKYSITDLDVLIERIKVTNSISEEEIAKRLGYNEGYISQTRSRGKVSAKFIQSIEREFRDELHSAKRVLGEIDHRDDMIAILKESNRLHRERQDSQINLKRLDEKIEAIAQFQFAIVDILKEFAASDDRKGKSVYNKIVAILKKRKLEGSLL